MAVKWSYSRVSCFKQCPYRYHLRYIDKFKTLPDQKPDNALYLGLGLHKGIETTVEEGLAEYRNNFYVMNDEIINWSCQLEYWIPRVKDLLPPNGQHEVEVSTENFIGYIDYIAGDTLYDFKFSNNVDSYLKSPQLSIYKYYLEKHDKSQHINHLKYVFIPKCRIRQKKTETIAQFRQRLFGELSKLEIQVIEVPYDEDSIIEFLEERKQIETAVEYPKNQNRLCDFCEYREYCLNGEDYELVQLPSTERRKLGSITKRRIWLYGRPFSGKTTFADSAPNPLMLNTDGNIEYVTAPYIAIKDEVTMNGRMVQRKFAWQVFKEAIDELEKGKNGFKTIIVDLLEDIYESCRLYMYDKLHITHESDDSFRAWDKVRTEYLSTMRRFMNLDYENIILLSQEDSTKDITKKSGENITSIKPNLTDKCANKIAGMVDIVGRVVVDGNNRTIQFKADDVIFGGGRLKTNVSEIPLEWDALIKVFDDANKAMNAGGKK